MNNFPSFKHRNALLPLYTHRHTHTRPHIRNFSVDIFVVNTPVYLSSSAISRYFFSFRVTRHIKPLQLTALKRLAVTDKHWDYLPLGCSYSHNTGSVVSCVREERSPNSAGQRILFLLIEASSSDEGRVIRRCNVNLWINYIRACLSKIVGFCFVYAHKQYQVYTYTQNNYTHTYNHIDKAQIATHTHNHSNKLRTHSFAGSLWENLSSLYTRESKSPLAECGLSWWRHVTRLGTNLWFLAPLNVAEIVWFCVRFCDRNGPEGLLYPDTIFCLIVHPQAVSRRLKRISNRLYIQNLDTTRADM